MSGRTVRPPFPLTTSYLPACRLVAEYRALDSQAEDHESAQHGVASVVKIQALVGLGSGGELPESAVLKHRCPTVCLPNIFPSSTSSSSAASSSSSSVPAQKNERAR
jgi:hypothetical protein